MEPARVVVAGGGLTGLATALALHSRGIRVQVLERAAERRGLGTAVSVDRDLLERATGLAAGDLPVVRSSSYDLTAWGDLFAWLSTRVQRARIPVEHGQQVVSVTSADPTNQGQPTRVVLAGGGSRRASVVVGADGVQSVMRRLVEPEQPLAESSGYLVWRGLVAEADLSGASRPQARDGFQVHYAADFALGAYVVPGPDASMVPGRRRLAFAWCDARRHPRLAAGAGGEDGRLATVPAEAIDDDLGRELAAEALEVWPNPWGPAIAWAFQRREAFATPIAEHWPHRLVSGSIALVGDAAHAVTPMTGSGLRNGLLDVIALADAVRLYGPTARALAVYEAERLGPSRLLVEQGRRMGREWLNSIAGH